MSEYIRSDGGIRGIVHASQVGGGHHPPSPPLEAGVWDSRGITPPVELPRNIFWFSTLPQVSFSAFWKQERWFLVKELVLKTFEINTAQPRDFSPLMKVLVLFHAFIIMINNSPIPLNHVYDR